MKHTPKIFQRQDYFLAISYTTLQNVKVKSSIILFFSWHMIEGHETKITSVLEKSEEWKAEHSHAYLSLSISENFLTFEGFLRSYPFLKTEWYLGGKMLMHLLGIKKYLSVLIFFPATGIRRQNASEIRFPLQQSQQITLGCVILPTSLRHDESCVECIASRTY